MSQKGQCSFLFSLVRNRTIIVQLDVNMNCRGRDQLNINNKQIGKLNSIYHQFAMKYSLSDSEFQILYTLQFFGDGCLLHEIVEFTEIPKQTNHSALKKMEKEKWLYLEDVNPKRKRIFLTNQGKDVALNTVQKVIDIESKIFENYDEEKINIYLEFMDELTKKLKLELKQVKGVEE